MGKIGRFLWMKFMIVQNHEQNHHKMHGSDNDFLAADHPNMKGNHLISKYTKVLLEHFVRNRPGTDRSEGLKGKP